MSHNFRPPMGALSRYSQTLGKIWLSKASLGSHEERGFRDHIFRPPSFRSRPTEPILAADANGGCGARLWENAWDEAADALCSPARQLGCRIDRLTWRKRGDQVLIAAISGPTPKIVIIRFRL